MAETVPKGFRHTTRFGRQRSSRLGRSGTAGFFARHEIKRKELLGYSFNLHWLGRPAWRPPAPSPILQQLPQPDGVARGSALLIVIEINEDIASLLGP
jgi:hypothetical protein